MIFPPDRILKMRDVINSSRTRIQHRTRKSIFFRLIKYVEDSETDEEFYARAWKDFPVWCLAFLNDDSGNPFFLALWQINYARLMDEKKYVWALCSRKVGKSTLLALKNLHDMCGNIPKRIICFAPTKKQDYVFEKMNKYLSESDYLYRVFGQTGSITADYIRLPNGSSCENRTIGLQTKGELIRGEYGDIVTVDEVQKIEDIVMHQVIKPIIADAYSEKKFRIIGTPNLYTNPNLEKNWNEWVANSEKKNTEYGVMHVDWKRGVKEGAIDEQYVRGEKEIMPPEEFAMEYEARFPAQAGRYFPLSLLMEAIDPELEFKFVKRPNCDYVMAVDYAAFANRTQILVGEYDYEKKQLRYVDWLELDPKREKIDYEVQIEIIKDMFWKYDCSWICPDATSTQDALMRMLIMSPNGIPTGRIYQTGERLGYVATDVLNDMMWKNHKQQLTRRRIKIPGTGSESQKFLEKWAREHNELNVKHIRNGNLIKLEEPKTGYKDLAITSGMLSLYIPTVERSKASFDIIGF